jgi:NitT/TauT family transport system substrate-binding protein
MIRGMRPNACLAASLALAAGLTAAPCADAQLRIYGNTTTIELAPVLLAAQDLYGSTAAVVNGGIPDLFDADAADVATNAETQALRQSVDHPDLRTILTVSEGFYRIVARKSAGIATLADLRGKRITTAPNTSSAYYLHKMLGTVGLTAADVTIVPLSPLSRMPAALAALEVDAITIWEPEIENAKIALGDDAIEFQDRKVYRELFSLHTTAAHLADPAKRREIVRFVRAVVHASERIRANPAEVWPLVAARTGYDLALIERVWHHEGYPGTLVADTLDVMVEEDAFVAQERGREPRRRATLAALVDDSVLREALVAE